MKKRAVCIHGHFYQPPRENPWLGEVGMQRSAAPYHDWNERVTAECYAPNTAARILDADGLIEEIVNNYARISFTAAPTLLSWLARHRPAVYEAILAADHESQERYAGHGSAIACCYNHIIMPLATRRDKRRQVVWGVRDFAARFGRMPEGMWLPETAVDLESLDLMAEAGILFTILAPHQAARVREMGTATWTEVAGETLDTTMPYVCRLPSGRRIAIFFYNAGISQEVAFGDLLSNGERFAERLVEAFSPEGERSELVHIATDGETYGHHRKFGDMALAYCLRSLESHQNVSLTVYGAYLAANPPTHEVTIQEGTSWSCPHGIERWREDCGCSSGAHPAWSQAWRGPLREAIVMVRDTITPRLDEALAEILDDPLTARDDAVSLVLGTWSDEAVEAFIARHTTGNLSAEERQRLLALFEIERQANLMQTSCGWFFDDIAEPGSVQVIRHAKRAIDLARRVLGLDLEPAFVETLQRARGNDPGHATGAEVYDARIRPRVFDLPRIAAGVALYALFGLEHPAATSGMHAIQVEWPYRLNAGDGRRILGRVHLRSRAAGEEGAYDTAALFDGIDRIVLGVNEPGGDAAIREALAGPDPAGAIPAGFSRLYTAADLSDEERWAIAREMIPGIEEAVCGVYLDGSTLIRTLKDLGVPLPGAAAHLVAYARSRCLASIFEEGCPDPGRFLAIAKEVEALNAAPDIPALAAAAARRIEGSIRAAAARPDDPAPLEEIPRIVGCARLLELPLDLWESQNICIRLRGHYTEMCGRAGRGDGGAERWVEAYRRAAVSLGVRALQGARRG